METTTTKALLLEVIGEIEQTDSGMFKPPSKMKKTDRQIGLIEDEFLKKAFVLYTFYQRELEQLKAKFRFEPNNLELEKEGQKLDAKTDLLREIFWFSVRTKFDCFHYVEIGVRSGWEVVEDKEDKNPGARILKNLLNLD